LAIYDILGREITVLQNRLVNAGVHESVWDGRNSEGIIVGNGVYIYRFEAGNQIKSGKVMFLR